MPCDLPQVVADKSPVLLDFHLEFVSLEAATKVTINLYVSKLRFSV